MDECRCMVSGELGIALSGGGARALAQLGVLKVLDREGIPVSYVAGTSGGAVIGAVYATSGDAREAEGRLVAHLRTNGTGFNTETFELLASSQHRPASSLIGLARRVGRALRAEGSLIGGKEMRASLATLLGPRTFADTRLPFATTALDLISGRRMIFAGGPLVDAVYASSAIPGLFEPLHLEDHVLVDGSWAEPIPVDTCHHLGAIHIIAVDVPVGPTDITDLGALATALRADTLARDLLEEAQLTQADFVVRPQVTVKHLADFSDPYGLITAGERAAEAVLPSLAAVLERHHALFVRGPGVSSPCRAHPSPSKDAPLNAGSAGHRTP